MIHIFLPLSTHVSPINPTYLSIALIIIFILIKKITKLRSLWVCAVSLLYGIYKEL